jgi:hypothetical protein
MASVHVSTGASYDPLEHCGVGGLGGGRAMVAVAGLMLLGLAHAALWLVAAAYRASSSAEGRARVRGARVMSASFIRLLGTLVVAGAPVLLLAFGSVCVTSGDHCGVRGTGGGVGMIIAGVLLSIGLLAHHSWYQLRPLVLAAAPPKSLQAALKFNMANPDHAGIPRRSSMAAMQPVSAEEADTLHRDLQQNAFLSCSFYFASLLSGAFGSVCYVGAGRVHTRSFEETCGLGGSADTHAGNGFTNAVLCGVFGLVAVFSSLYSGASPAHARRMCETASEPFNQILGLFLFTSSVMGGLAAPGLLLVFGTLCRSEGEYCGAGGDEGGYAMLAVGALILVAGFVYFMHERSEYKNTSEYVQNVIFIFVLYTAGALMAVFGSVCEVSDGAEHCGVGQLPGGKAMLAIGPVFMMTASILFWTIWVVEDDELNDANGRVTSVTEHFKHLAQELLTSGGPLLLLAFGSMCVDSGTHCAFSNESGGIAFCVIGAFLTLYGLARRVHDMMLLDIGDDQTEADLARQAAAAAAAGGSRRRRRDPSKQHHDPDSLWELYEQAKRLHVRLTTKVNDHDEASFELLFIHNAVFGQILYMISVALGSCGAVCVSSRGERGPVCGHSGMAGGVAELIVCGVLGFTSINLSLFAARSKSNASMLQPYSHRFNAFIFRLLKVVFFATLWLGPCLLLLFGTACLDALDRETAEAAWAAGGDSPAALTLQSSGLQGTGGSAAVSMYCMPREPYHGDLRTAAWAKVAGGAVLAAIAICRVLVLSLRLVTHQEEAEEQEDQRNGNGGHRNGGSSSPASKRRRSSIASLRSANGDDEKLVAEGWCVLGMLGYCGIRARMTRVHTTAGCLILLVSASVMGVFGTMCVSAHAFLVEAPVGGNFTNQVARPFLGGEDERQWLMCGSGGYAGGVMMVLLCGPLCLLTGAVRWYVNDEELAAYQWVVDKDLEGGGIRAANAADSGAQDPKASSTPNGDRLETFLRTVHTNALWLAVVAAPPLLLFFGSACVSSSEARWCRGQLGSDALRFAKVPNGEAAGGAMLGIGVLLALRIINWGRDQAERLVFVNVAVLATVYGVGNILVATAAHCTVVTMRTGDGSPRIAADAASAAAAASAQLAANQPEPGTNTTYSGTYSGLFAEHAQARADARWREQFDACGYGTEGGGVAMLVIGLLCTVLGGAAAVAVARSEERAEACAAYLLGTWARLRKPAVYCAHFLTCVVPPVLAAFGALCANYGAQCGVHGSQAGGIVMMAFAGVGVLSLYYRGRHHFPDSYDGA